MRTLGKILILIPFINLLVEMVPSLQDVNIYYIGLWGLVLMGVVGVLFNINRILGIVYILVGYGFYVHYVGYEINNLWPVGGLILLINEKISAEVAQVEKTEDKNPKKHSEEVRVVPKKVKKVVAVAVPPKRMSREEEFWMRYDAKNKKGIFIKLKDNINKLLSVG